MKKKLIRELLIEEEILTCFIAISPILSECFRIFSKKSLRSDMDASLIEFLNFGIVSHITWKKNSKNQQTLNMELLLIIYSHLKHTLIRILVINSTTMHML